MNCYWGRAHAGPIEAHSARDSGANGAKSREVALPECGISKVSGFPEGCFSMREPDREDRTRQIRS